MMEKTESARTEGGSMLERDGERSEMRVQVIPGPLGDVARLKAGKVSSWSI